MQPKKKILFISSTLNTGGAQKILSNLLMALPKSYEAELLLNDSKKIAYPYRGTITDLGFSEQDDKTNLWYQVRVFIRRIAVIKKKKKTKEYFAAISFMDSANVANILTGRKYCKSIISVHTDLMALQKQWKYRLIVLPLSRLLYPKADRVIAVSDGVRDQLIHQLGIKDEHVVAIRNGHDIQGIRRLADEDLPIEDKQFFAGKTVICTMGRMDIVKGQWHLIRAMKAVCEKIPNAVLIILGDGEMKEYQMRLARELDIAEHILFKGFLQNPFAYMKESDIFVLPSILEGLPNALIEALAIGLPCVSTDFGSGVWEILDANKEYDPNKGKIKEIYYAEYGLVTPVCDGVCYSENDPLTKEERYLADAISVLINDAELKETYHKKSSEVVKNFESSVMAERWIEVINES